MTSPAASCSGSAGGWRTVQCGGTDFGHWALTEEHGLITNVLRSWGSRESSLPRADLTWATAASPSCFQTFHLFASPSLPCFTPSWQGAGEGDSRASGLRGRLTLNSLDLVPKWPSHSMKHFSPTINMCSACDTPPSNQHQPRAGRGTSKPNPSN